MSKYGARTTVEGFSAMSLESMGSDAGGNCKKEHGVARDPQLNHAIFFSSTSYIPSPDCRSKSSSASRTNCLSE